MVGLSKPPTIKELPLGALSQYSPCTWLPARAVGPQHECCPSTEFLQSVAKFLVFKGQYNLKASYTGVAKDSFQYEWELQIYGKIKNVLNFNSFHLISPYCDSWAWLLTCRKSLLNIHIHFIFFHIALLGSVVSSKYLLIRTFYYK